MLKSNKYIYLLLVISFLSCEKEVNWDLEAPKNEIIIVEGHITNEVKRHEIRISKPGKLNESPQWISGAQVEIRTNTSTYPLTEFSPGIYKTDSTFQAYIGTSYELSILLNNKEYKAIADILPVTPIEDSLQFTKVRDSLYKITHINNLYSSEQAMFEVFIDWSFLPGYDSLPLEKTQAKFYSYSLNTLDEQQLFQWDTENIIFPKGAKITEKKYSLTPEHAKYIRSLLSETQWRGGLFDAAPANLPTNLSAGAMGYFGVSSVVVKSIVF